ncbi:AraC-like transcriptional regulator QhpR [Novosphingobium terrae]|uniref:AraC-like transcriptional regulator QhpR n=1 Tax=Novosphingobium terrae TaxID=2726189 RepID=UPI001981BA6F|nr:AraC family transcriptional regulator [Novosphingobium terrae]
MIRASVRSTALHGWHDMLADKGHMLGQNIAENPHSARSDMMSLQDFVSFSEGVVEQARDIAIPWLVGTHYDLANLGQIGPAILSANSVGVALRRLVDYFALLQDSTDIALHRDEQTATVSYRILSPDIWPRHQDAMFTLGIVSQILRQGQGSGWDRIDFAFEAERHDMRGDIGQVLNAPCSFGADTNQIRFPAAFLDLALRSSPQHSDVGALNRAIAQQRRQTPIIDRMAQLVFRDLNSFAVDQARLAREIGMSDRTMRRKLADAGSSYQQVLDECRMRQAAFEFQTRPELSIAQIALRLGYAEHSTFTRAFQRWSGMAPQSYRAQLAQHRAQ